MVALIFAISFVQLFHGHAHDKDGHGQHDQEEFKKSDKCTVCDFFLHKTGKDFMLLQPQYVALLFAEQRSRPIVENAGTYTNPSGGFSNKGPPLG